MAISKNTYTMGLLLLAQNCMAGVPLGASVGVGLTSIGSDYGYSLSLTSPCFNEGRSNLGIQFNQNVLSALSGNSYRDFNYYMIQANSRNRLHTTENYLLYLNTGVFHLFSDELTSYPGFGLNYAMGGEFFKTSSGSLYSELGWNFPFSVKANRVQNQAYARGIAMALGFKFYL